MRKDDVTLELPGVPGRRGRPSIGQAVSGADRMRAYRQRKAAEGKTAVTVFLPSDVADALRAYVDRQNANVAVDPITLADGIERVLRDRLMRKR